MEALRELKKDPRVPKRARGSTKRVQESPKRAQESPKRAPREPKRPPREVHEGSKMELPCRRGDDFRDFGKTPALGLLWAVLRPQESAKTAQENPRKVGTDPREPRDAPRYPRGRQGPSKRQLLEALKWRSEAQNRGSRRGAVHISGKPS